MIFKAFHTLVRVATVGGCMTPELTVSALCWLLLGAIIFLPSDPQFVDGSVLVEQLVECDVVFFKEDQEDWVVA